MLLDPTQGGETGQDPDLPLPVPLQGSQPVRSGSHAPAQCTGQPRHVLVQTEEGGSPERREQPRLPTQGKFRRALTALTGSVLSRTALKEEHGFQSGGYSP